MPCCIVVHTYVDTPTTTSRTDIAMTDLMRKMMVKKKMGETRFILCMHSDSTYCFTFLSLNSATHHTARAAAAAA